MQRIVFVIEQLYGGGAERVTAALANALCRVNNLEIHIVSYRRDEARDYGTDNRIQFHTYNAEPQTRLRGMYSRAMYLSKTIKQVNPDCVVSLAIPRTTILLTLAMLGSKIPVILSERNDPSQYPASRTLRVLRNIAYFLCKGVVFQTKDSQQYFNKWVRRKSTIICNPVTGNMPSRYEGNREKCIVNFCRLDSQKNLDLLIDSFKEVRKIFPDYTLSIYGEGPEKDRLQKRIVDEGLSDSIFLCGHSKHIYEDVYKAALFVSSSDYEGISNSMLEAIALGIPSVCTDCPIGGARAVIKDGINGFLVPVGDKEKLTETILKVLQNNELAESLSLEGSKLRNTLDSENVAKRWLEFIESVI